MRCNYLLQRGANYYFRVRIPQGLRRWFGGRTELKRSLNTFRYESAKSLVRPWIYRTEQLFLQIRSGMLTDEQIQKLVTDFLQQSLEEEEEGRLSGTGLMVESEDGEHGTNSLEGLELHLATLVEDLAKGSYEHVAPVADAILTGGVNPSR